MALGELNITAGDVVREIIVALLDKFTWLMTFIKAVGILVIIYALYLVIKIFRDMKMRSRVKKIEDKVGLIDKKLDVLLNSKTVKIDSPDKKEKSEKKSFGFFNKFFKKKDVKKKKSKK